VLAPRVSNRKKRIGRNESEKAKPEVAGVAKIGKGFPKTGTPRGDFHQGDFWKNRRKKKTRRPKFFDPEKKRAKREI
jgi:hypothetical protein